MAVAREIKFVQLTIRLGAFPKFELHADERVTISPEKANYATSTAAGASPALLASVLDALAAGGSSITLFVDGNVVVEPEDDDGT